MTRCPNCYAAMPLIVDECVKCHRPVQRFTPIERDFFDRTPKRPRLIARSWHWYATAPDWFRVLVPWFVALVMLATLPLFVFMPWM